MQKIKIVTDSGCDIPIKAKLNNVEIIGIYITVNGKTYEERKDIFVKEYYDILEKCDDIPKTSHITMMRYGESYERLVKQGATHIIVVCLNGGASSTYNAAVMAKKMYFEEHPGANTVIEVIDSESYSVGYGWPVMQADKMIDRGEDFDSVLTYIKNRLAKTEILVSAYNLKFLRKSGRVPAAAAFVGDALGLKPIITLIHGESKAIAKVRGDRAVIPALIEQYKKRAADPGGPYIIGYTYEEYGKELYSACVKEIGHPPVLSANLGCVISTNAGNRAVGMMYTGK